MSRILSGFLIASMLCAPGVVSHAAAQSKPKPVPSAQTAFDTPEMAAEALLKAAESYDVPVLLQILGSDAQDLVSSDDSVSDKERASEFAKSGKEKHSIALNPKNAGRAELLVGNDDWPLPIPIVRRNGKWYYDTKAGRQEILFRRVGQNELDTIEACHLFVEAQKEYALEKHDGAHVTQYAQRIVSTAGKHDGLAWQNPDGTWGGPLGEEVAKAVEQGYNLNSPPYNGYYFKVLKGQGAAAPLGEIDFMVGGIMIGGFALAAAPAQYGVTGIQTFIVSHDGIVYQKDLGPDTPALFKSMDRYNPDKTWKPAEDEK